LLTEGSEKNYVESCNDKMKVNLEHRDRKRTLKRTLTRFMKRQDWSSSIIGLKEYNFVFKEWNIGVWDFNDRVILEDNVL
jgi:hypothetical protein